MLADVGSGGGDRPDVEERYTTATNATSLRVDEHQQRAGPVDVLAAAAWSPARIGAALLRLHSEFDGGQRASQGPHRGSDGKMVVPTEALLLAMRLKTMPAAREQLTLQAMKWEMDEAAETARQVLNWWLDQRCPKCEGRRFQAIQGTPSLSGKLCPPPSKDGRGGCGGTGAIAIPCGQEGKRLANFMDDCVSRARQSIQQRLRNSR